MMKLSNFTTLFSNYHAARQLVTFLLLVVMLDRPCSEVRWKSTGYPLHSPVSQRVPAGFKQALHHVSNSVYILTAAKFCIFQTKTKNGETLRLGSGTREGMTRTPGRSKIGSNHRKHRKREGMTEHKDDL